MKHGFAKALALAALMVTPTLLEGCGGGGLQSDVATGANVGGIIAGPGGALVGAAAGAVAAQVSPEKTFICTGEIHCTKPPHEDEENDFHYCDHRGGKEVDARDAGEAWQKLRDACAEAAEKKSSGEWKCTHDLTCD